MPIASLLPIAASAKSSVLELNNAYAEELSYLDGPELSWIIAHAFHARRIGDLDGFLIAFDERAEYSSTNFLWFRAHYPRFVYIDRVVVNPTARRKSLARSLYLDLFAAAVRAKHTVVGCEVNIIPPNPVSDAFHASMGFVEVDRATANVRLVRYLVHDLHNYDIDAGRLQEHFAKRNCSNEG
jgi:predicted GNAT superfamily acetyltransferase